MAVALANRDPQIAPCSPPLVGRRKLRSNLVMWLFVLAMRCAVAQTVAVTTYHVDNYRTGWNKTETRLTPTAVSGSTFGILRTVPLDQRVDAQPLVVPGVNVTAGKYQGRHNVVYVVTANTTVYMIDADNGTILLSTNFGHPAPKPPGCNSGKLGVGITSTPVIDRASGTLYLMAYTNDTSGPTYRVHALDVGNLTDKVTPQIVSASHTLVNGKTFTFNANYQRQRPGLLLVNGNVYAGFGSFCDLNANLSRGWVLGWNAATLTPLVSNQLVDTQVGTTKTVFLSSIWMSGYALAADSAGNVLFATGNSEAGTYDGETNLQESAVKLSPDLSSVVDLFTPSDQHGLDLADIDFGSGGVMVLPDQGGNIPHLAVAAGKEGTMFLMNEDNLGGYSAFKDNVLGSYWVGHCWCGQSYFVDSDHVPRVVSSGGNVVRLWKLTTNPSPVLTSAGISNPILTGQDPGFFTTISSNGMATPVIWALSKDHVNNIYLYAYDPDTQVKGIIKQIYQNIVGSWPIPSANANLVPVVANGKVYVASYQELTILGLKHVAPSHP